MKTPIAIFTYNRPHHTQRLLASLQANARLADCECIIFCDGIKQPEHAESVAQTRAIVQKWALQHSATVIEHTENYGLKRSIERGVQQLCASHGRVIVLEDDLRLHPDFVHFHLEALDTYADNEQVMQIAGYRFPFDYTPQQDAFLMPISTTWGWSTWARAWAYYNPDPTLALQDLAHASRAHAFDLGGIYPYSRMIKQVSDGQVSSWGVLFWYAVWNTRRLVVYPSQNLVANEGFDGSGVHSGRNTQLAQAQTMPATRLPATLDMPREVDQQAYLIFQQYIRQSQPHPKRHTVFRYVRQALQSIIKPMRT
jgi:hypothetical protein